MALNMVQMELEPRPLYDWARQVGVDARDRGYLVHSALRAAFGKAAPQPFAVYGNAANPLLKVLGYGAAAKGELLAVLALAEPVLSAVFRPDGLLDKPMPDPLPEGLEVGFHVECCPVTRNTSPEGACREKDAFLAACDAHPEGDLDRATVYAAWTARELSRDGAAEVLDCSMRGFRLFTPVRRGNGTAAGRMGRRPRATMNGVLRVASAAAFEALLARGIGRHRAFGLGMLLLRPV